MNEVCEKISPEAKFKKFRDFVYTYKKTYIIS